MIRNEEQQQQQPAAAGCAHGMAVLAATHWSSCRESSSSWAAAMQAWAVCGAQMPHVWLHGQARSAARQQCNGFV
jgi:hypothetical protein